MFTGIVEEVGLVEQPGSRMRVSCRSVLVGSKIGSSIAVNGTCLTAIEIDATGFWMDLSPETLARTNLGDLKPGDEQKLQVQVMPLEEGEIGAGESAAGGGGGWKKQGVGSAADGVSHSAKIVTDRTIADAPMTSTGI